jgi:homoserine O-succinyltransferase/O-acetyltransferase
MPLILNTDPSHLSLRSCTKKCAKPSPACLDRSSRNLTIGLVNNMPDSALEATERQFISLLDLASEGFSIRVRLYSLPGVSRSGASAGRVSQFYTSAANLPDSQLDGLIVTGREPLTPNLADEPYWESFTTVLEWARLNTYSTVWSCLAAHAAVLYQDGIKRVKNERKHFGIFDCSRISKHPLTEGIPSRFKVPHSRWNGLPEDELSARGYSVLSRAADAGVDTFVQQHKSLFVFFQGHPEYEPNTPLLEYRRDIGRFVRGEMGTYPTMPRGYFDADSLARLTKLQQDSAMGPREGLLAGVLEILEKVDPQQTWRSTAIRLYRNWLQYISARKLAELQAANDTVEGPELVPVGSYVNVTDLSGRLEPGHPGVAIL